MRDDWRISLQSPYDGPRDKDVKMLDDTNRLDLTAKDIELIEAALHTQKKILSMQSKAGGTGARQKLYDLKSLMRRIGHTRAPRTSTTALSLSQMARSFFCVGQSCPNER